MSLQQKSPVFAPAGPEWARALNEANRLAATEGVNTTLVPEIDDASALTVEQAFSQAIDDSQVVLLGENHSTWDEALFIPMLEKAKAQGVKYVTLEFPSNLQGALDTYVRTGKNVFPHDAQDIGRRGLPHLEFARAVFRAGLGVVAIDMPEKELLSKLASENLLSRYMAWKANPASGDDSSVLRALQLRDEAQAKNLGALAKSGKAIALVGGAHVISDSQPAPTSRTLLEQQDIKVTALRLERRDSRSGDIPVFDQAYVNVFGNSAPKSSFAYPTCKLHGLGHADFKHELMTDPHFPLIPYDRSPQDYVVFLSDEFQKRNDAFHR